jgi:peptidylprolyl isomerase
VGTEKRERQKANRAQRQLEEARAQKVDATKRTFLRLVSIAVLAVGAVVLIVWVSGGFSSDDTPEAAVTVPPVTIPIDTTPVVTFPVPDKPEVELPAELPTELVITDLIKGEGPAAQVGDTVQVHYIGVISSTGEVFDNSYDRGTTFPVTIGTSRVIAGWTEGLVGVQTGTRRQLDIPADLAYGDQGNGSIQPGDAISFVIDVMSVEPAGS